MLSLCALEASTPVTPSVLDFAIVSEKVNCRKPALGTPTCQPNQILLSVPPTRMVPRLDPLGRSERFGMGGPAWAPPLPTPGVCAGTAIAPAMMDERLRACRQLLKRYPCLIKNALVILAVSSAVIGWSLEESSSTMMFGC
jgi:hypothetical protein